MLNFSALFGTKSFLPRHVNLTLHSDPEATAPAQYSQHIRSIISTASRRELQQNNANVAMLAMLIHVVIMFRSSLLSLRASVDANVPEGFIIETGTKW